MTGFNNLDVFVLKRNKFNCCLSVLRIEDSWIVSSQNFYPDVKDEVTDQELLSTFLESYVTNNQDRKEINLLFKGNISNETKNFLKKLNSPKINSHKPDNHNKNLLDIYLSGEDALSRNRNYL